MRATLDSRDLHLRTCKKMNNVNHEKHEALKFWFKDFAKQVHISTTVAPPISEVSPQNPTKQLAGDLMLVDVSLRQPGRDGKCGVIYFSIITPAAESYYAEAANVRFQIEGRCEGYQILSSIQENECTTYILMSRLSLRVEENLGKELKKYSRRSAILSPKLRAKVDHP